MTNMIATSDKEILTELKGRKSIRLPKELVSFIRSEENKSVTDVAFEKLSEIPRNTTKRAIEKKRCSGATLPAILNFYKKVKGEDFPISELSECN